MGIQKNMCKNLLYKLMVLVKIKLTILVYKIIILGRKFMFAGHFGVAAIVKAKAPEVPLWSLLVSSQLMDLVFLPLSFAGVEMI
jgi:hypothetical protein